jgi:phenylalanyl-tRNA synthetase beta chain
LEEEIRDLLVGCGLQEVITYSLTSLQREAALHPGKEAADLDAASYVTLSNPITQDRGVMRRHLLATMLETAADNLRFQDRFVAFEVGKVFELASGEELPDEALRLALVMTGVAEGRHWLAGESGQLDYFDLKGVVEALLARLGAKGVSFGAAEHPTFQPGRTAHLQAMASQPGSSSPTILGVLGEIHPTVRQAFGLGDGRVAAAELDLIAIMDLVPHESYVEPVPAYPAVLQDLAVLVDDKLPAATVGALITQTGGFLLKKVELFDVYRGDAIPAGKKSLAFGLTFRAPDKTLRDAIVAKQVKRIVKRLASELGAEQRA